MLHDMQLLSADSFYKAKWIWRLLQRS